jgi:uncharacterized protein (DUF927 family)
MRESKSQSADSSDVKGTKAHFSRVKSSRSPDENVKQEEIMQSSGGRNGIKSSVGFLLNIILFFLFFSLNRKEKLFVYLQKYSFSISNMLVPVEEEWGVSFGYFSLLCTPILLKI